MFIALYALATVFLIVAVLYVEARLSNRCYSDNGNALLRAIDRWDQWQYYRLYGNGREAAK